MALISYCCGVNGIFTWIWEYLLRISRSAVLFNYVGLNYRFYRSFFVLKYRNLWSMKTIGYFSYLVAYFRLLVAIVFESLYTSHTVMLIEYYFLFGFFWNLWEFCAITQLSLRASDVDIHVCDEEYILWRSAGGSLSLILKEFLSFVCFLNTPLKVLQGLDRWYFDDSKL